MNLNFRRLLTRVASLVLCAVVLGAGACAALAQQQQAPLTNAEFLALVRQLPKRPDLKAQLIAEIRRRGINFPLTSGLRAFVSTKSGGDEELRRVLEEAERRFTNAGGANSTGEFVSILKGLFEEESKTEFKPLDTDTLRGRRTIVYEYDIKKENSKWLLDQGDSSTIVAHRGKVWVDREKFRVLRVESTAYEIPASFAISGATVAVDYDWVTIAGQGDYLLPSRSVIVMTLAEREQLVQFRNDIRFRNYQKFGTELKIIEDDIIDE